MRKRSLILTSVIASASLALLGTTGCGHYPRPIHSGRSIWWAPASEYEIVIVNLPLKDWPKLQKFAGLRHLRISQRTAPEITDEHLKVLSRLNLPKLRDVSFAYGYRVTDEGIQAVAALSSITSLQLIGTGITDKGMHTLATQFHQLKGLNVEACVSLTPSGFLALTNSRTINSLSLSIDNFSQRQVEGLITEVKNVTWWTLKDPHGTLDLDSLRRLGMARKVTIQRSDANNSVRSIFRGPQP